MTQPNPAFLPPPMRKAVPQPRTARRFAETPEADAAPLILEEAAELASLWPEVRDDPAVGALQARDVLAIWCHLLRFPPEIAAASPAQQLRQLVAADRERIVSQLLSLTPGGWQQVAGVLAENLQDAEAPGEFEIFERQACELFDELDRNSLAVHAASLLLPADDPLRERLNQVHTVIAADEEYLAEHPQTFLPAAGMASALLRACRADLDESDEALWLTTLKHHALEQLDEQARDALLGQPTAADAADLKTAFRG